MTDHADLISRLQSAEHGSPKLGAEVLTAVTGDRHEVRASSVHMNSVHRYGLFSKGVQKADPTTDLNAAIALMDKHLPKGLIWCLWYDGEIWTNNARGNEPGQTFGPGPRELRMCIALLSALNTGGEDE